MTFHITAADSRFAAHLSALQGGTPDTLIVDADAYLIAGPLAGHAVDLKGSWNIAFNGEVSAFATGADGLLISALP